VSELSHLVFSTASGGILDPSNVRNRWHRKALAGAGLNPQLRLHDLRHTAATIAVPAGGSVLFVQANSVTRTCARRSDMPTPITTRTA